MSDEEMACHCPEHSGIVAEQRNLSRYASDIHAELKRHCNGGSNHVTRREVDDLAGQVRENSKRIEQQREAKLAWWDKIEMAIITTLIATAIGLLTAYLQ